MAIRFNPYQQRMPSFRRPPPFDPFQQTRDPRGFRGGRRSRFNPFMNRGIGGFGGMFGGRGQRRRPPPRRRFPTGRQSFGGFGGRGRGGMFGGFPQHYGVESRVADMFGGIGGMGRRRGFNPFMNQFGGGFNPFARFGGVDPRVGKPTPQEAPALEPQVMGGPDAPAAPPPMETTAPVMPAAPQPFTPAPPATPQLDNVVDYQNLDYQPAELPYETFPDLTPFIPPAPPTVGPPGTTVTPPAPTGNQYISPQEQFLTDHPDLDWTPLTPSPAPSAGVPAVTPTTPLPLPTQNSIGNILPSVPEFDLTPSDAGGGMLKGGPSGGTIPGTNIPLPPNMPISRDPWGGMCPHPNEEILLADDSWIKAKDIQVGDKVKTLTAKDFKAGEYEITRVEIIDNQPRCEVFFKDSKSIISSYSHPYAVEDKGFVEAQNIKTGDTVGDLIVTEVKPLDWGSVVSLSVDKAETYMLKAGSEDKPVAVLSHNKSIAPPPAGPRPGEPGYEAWRVKKDAELGQKWAQNPPMPGTGHWTAYQKWLERGNNPIPAAQAMLETYPVSQPHGPPSLADEGSPEAPIGPPPTGNQYGPQPLLPSMPGKEPRTPPFIGRGPGSPLPPSIPPVNVVQENIEREIIPPQLPVAPIQQQATPNTLMVQDREPGFTQADIMRPQMTGTPATAFPSLLPHQQFAPTNLMGEPQKKALRDILKGSFGFGGL